MTGWEYVADIAAAVGGIASLLAVIVATSALADAHAARQEASRDRDRRRLELIAEHLDRMRNAAVADLAHVPQRNDWRLGLGLLRRYLAASSLSLPKCHEIAVIGAAGQAIPAMLDANAEITDALGQLAEQDAGAARGSSWLPPCVRRILPGLPARPA